MSLPVSFTAPRAATEASDDTESRVGGQFGVSSLADTMAEIDGEVAPLTCGFRVHLKKPLPPNADAMERLALVVSDGLVKKARAENNGRTIYGTLLDELQYDAFQEEAACLGRVEKDRGGAEGGEGWRFCHCCLAGEGGGFAGEKPHTFEGVGGGTSRMGGCAEVVGRLLLGD
eukprot:4620143-Pyramimonas_sp.AAC.1